VEFLIDRERPDIDMQFTQTISRKGVLAHLIAELERGVEMVRGLDDIAYRSSPQGGSSIGAHIRHNLDFINALQNGLEQLQVDYNQRLRDPRVENDRAYAMEQLSVACSRLELLPVRVLGASIKVRSELDEDVWHTSSVHREVEFLHSHTVHHYALVAMLITASGRYVSTEFGVAPSTLRFRASTG
jgi:hypothetical protein